MSCQYYFNNKLIGNIHELNSFLLFKFPNYKELGDYIFLITDELNLVNRQLHSLKESTQKLKRLKDTDFELGVDGEIHEKYQDSVAIAISKFLQTYINAEDKVITPYFDAINYWSLRVMTWADPKNSQKLRKISGDGTVLLEGFTEEEADLLDNNLVPLDYDKSIMTSEGKLDLNKLPFTQKRLISEIEDRWKYLAELGIAIHNIYATYFKKVPVNNSFQNKDKNFVYLYELWEKNPSSIEISIENYFSDPNSLGYIDPKYLTKSLIKEFIKKAEELRLELESKFLTEEEKRLNKSLDFNIEAPVSSKMAVHTNEKEEGNPFKTLAGRLDLLVTTPSGKLKVIDFKVGNKSYDKYDSAKKLTYIYQLAFYDRILLLNRLCNSSKDIENYIVPIEIENIHKRENPENFKFKYNKENDSILRDITADTNSLKVLKEVNRVLPYQENEIVADDTELIQKHEKVTKLLFGESLSDTEEISDEDIINLITKNKTEPITPNDYGYYEYEFNSNLRVSIKNTGPEAEARFIQEVKNTYKTNVQTQKALSNILLNAMELAKENEILLSESNDKNLNILGELNIAKLDKYCMPGSNWKLAISPNAALLFKLYNIIIFQKENSLGETIYDVIKIDNHLSTNWFKGVSSGRNNCDFQFALNSEELQNPDSLMLKALRGNITLLETYLLLHESGLKNAKINNIAIINPYGSKSKYFSTSILEIEYSLKHTLYKAKNKYKSDPNSILNKISLEPTLGVSDSVSQLVSLYDDLITDNSTKVIKDIQSDVEGISSIWSTSLDMQELSLLLKDILLKLEEKAPYLKLDKTLTSRTFNKVLGYSTTRQKIELFYFLVEKTLMDISNFKERLAYQSTPDYFNSANPFTLAREGLYGNLTDNPGNYKSYYVNKVSKLILNSIQDVRIKLMNTVKDNREDVKTFDKELQKSYGGFFTNPTERFKGMTYITEDNSDILFINPWKKYPASKIPGDFNEAHFNYLKKVILKLNKLRYPNLAEESLLKILSEGSDENTIKYLQVPILPPSLCSKLSEFGVTKFFFRKMKNLVDTEDFKKAWEEKTKDMDIDFLSESEESIIFEVLNKFSKSSGEDRIKVIQDLITKYGKETCWETNIELLLGLYEQSKINLDTHKNIVPIIKGASLILQQLGVNINDNFDSEIQTIEDLFKRNINNLSITSKNELKLIKLAKPVMKFASYAALAFSPVQYLGLRLDGICNLAKLSYISSDHVGESTPFTKEELHRAFSIVNDSISKGTDDSLIDQLNIFLGVNDMDIDSYINNMKYSKNYSVFNFDRIAFYTTSRPDFYNRMTLVIAQLIHEGSFDAFSLDENKRLKYDCTKDLRFKALFDGTSKDKEDYKKALGRYIAQVKILNSEGHNIVIDLNNLLKLTISHSNLEIESMKALGDMLYGYYDSAKKSLFLGKFAGGMVGQMKAFFSSKKNMYLGTEGSKNLMSWERVYQDENPNVYLVYAKKDDGSIDENLMVWSNEANASDIVVFKPKEIVTRGIANTFYKLVTADGVSLSSKIFHPEKTLRELCINANGLFDEKLYNSYIFNLRMFLGDLLTALLLGLIGTFVFTPLSENASKEAKKDPTLSKAATAAALKLFTKTLLYSAGNSNMFSSFAGLFLEWQPIALATGLDFAEDVVDVFLGEKSPIAVPLNTFAFTKTLVVPWYDEETIFGTKLKGKVLLENA